MAGSPHRLPSILILVGLGGLLLASPGPTAGAQGPEPVRTLDLTGGWMMEPGAKATVRRIRPRTVRLGDSWEAQGLTGVEGRITYRRTVHLEAPRPVGAPRGSWGVLLGPCRYGRYTLTANGERIGRSPHHSLAFPVPRMHAFRLPPEVIGPDGELTLRLDVERIGWASDPVASRAGPVGGTALLADLELLTHRAEAARLGALRDELPALAMGLVFVTFGIVQLIIFAWDRRRREYLWFGLLALTLAASTLLSSRWTGSWIPSFSLAWRLTDMSVHLAAALLITFLWSFFQHTPRPLISTYRFSHGLLAGLVLLLPAPLVVASRSGRWAWSILLIALVAGLLWEKVRFGTTEERLVAWGVSVVLAVVLADIGTLLLTGQGLRPFPALAPCLLLLAVAAAVAIRYHRQQDELLELRERLETRVAERTQQLHRVNSLLEELTLKDPLTGLGNRRHLRRTLEAEVRRAHRQRGLLSLLLIDLDHFKQYNDTYGHPEGDACLKRVAGLLGRLFRRAGDTVSRYGGEEFAVILADTRPAEALLLAERLREEIFALELPHSSSPYGRVTVSIGVATAAHREQCVPGWLLDAADRALYRAKEAGRNQAETEAVAPPSGPDEEVATGCEERSPERLDNIDTS